MEEIRWNDLHFYIVDTCEAICQSKGVGIISIWGRRGGGGWLTFFLRVLLLQGEVEVFRDVGYNFFFRRIKTILNAGVDNN